MLVPTSLTRQHIRIDRGISSLHSAIPRTGETDATELGELRAQSERVENMLQRYVHQEQGALLNHATRILGEALGEVTEIHTRNTQLLAGFAHLNQALADAQPPTPDDLRDIRARVRELQECFERQSESERKFYTLYSTILFPAGAATD